jgi:hypothetical protein
MAKQNDISHVLRQRCVTELCVKLRKSSEDIRDVTECIWNRSNEPIHTVSMVEEFYKRKQKCG